VKGGPFHFFSALHAKDKLLYVDSHGTSVQSLFVGGFFKSFGVYIPRLGGGYWIGLAAEARSGVDVVAFNFGLVYLGLKI